MKKDYQKSAVSATTPMLPEAVSIAMAELAGDVQEGLLAMAVGTGLQVMAALMNADVEASCGPKGRTRSGRSAVRHGTEAGSVTLGGRRVPVQRPRMRAADREGRAACAGVRTVQPDRGVGPDGDAADACRAVHSPLSGRGCELGRKAGRGVGRLDEQCRRSRAE